MTRHLVQQIAAVLITVDMFALMGYAVRRAQSRELARSIDFDHVDFADLDSNDWDVLTAYAKDLASRLECGEGCKFCQDVDAL